MEHHLEVDAGSMDDEKSAMVLEKWVVGPLQTNCYFIGSRDHREGIIIDPGNDAEAVLAYLEEKKYALAYILLTHAHFDHVGAAAALHRVTGAPIVAHRHERLIARSIPIQAAFFGFPRPQAFKINRWLEDGEQLQIGPLKGQIIHTPGHTPGGICFLINGFLFSGDTLFYEAIGRTDLPRGSHCKLLESIRTRLWPLPNVTQVLPGHGPATTIGHEKKYNPYLYPKYPW